MDKRFLVAQLAGKLRESAAVARRAEQQASVEAREGATPAEKREDARVALEQGSLARGQAERAARVNAELATLDVFHPVRLPPAGAIALGAVVEVEMETDEGGTQGRTFFLAPVGAGVELTGPDGDGYLSVVTPQSPIGRAVLGKRAGDTVEVNVKNEARAWKITFVE